MAGLEKRASEGEESPVNFYEFYETAIKARVLRKLEEEAMEESVEKPQHVAVEVPAQQNEDEDHPKVLMLEEEVVDKETLEAAAEAIVDTDDGEGEEKHIPRRPPRRRPATTNFPLLG